MGEGSEKLINVFRQRPSFKADINAIDNLVFHGISYKVYCPVPECCSDTCSRIHSVERLQPFADREIRTYQTDIMRGYASTNQIFSLRIILEKA